MASNRIPALTKDSTHPLASFFFNCSQAINNAIQDTFSTQLSTSVINCIESILAFCWDVLRVSQTTHFDEGIFQTYLQIGRSMNSRTSDKQSPLLKTLSVSLDAFNANWALSTGQSMQRLWDRWRPATAANPTCLRQIIELQHLSGRLNKVTLQADLSFSRLGQLHRSLANTQKSLLLGADGDELLQVSNLTTDMYIC